MRRTLKDIIWSARPSVQVRGWTQRDAQFGSMQDYGTPSLCFLPGGSRHAVATAAPRY